MIDFHNLPADAAGTLVAVNIRRDPSGDLGWDLDVAYQLIPEAVSHEALDHALPGTSLLVEEGITKTRKVTVKDSTERDDVRLTMTSLDTGEEMVGATVAEIRSITLRVKNDVSITTIRYRVCGTADQFIPVVRYLDARVNTRAEAVQVALPFNQKPVYDVSSGDLVSGMDLSGVLTCGIVMDVRDESCDVQEMSGMVVRVNREGMGPSTKITAPDFSGVDAWVDALQIKSNGTGIRPTWADVTVVLGQYYMKAGASARGDDGSFVLDSHIIDVLLDKGEVAN